MKDAGPAEALSGSGPFTVFATNRRGLLQSAKPTLRQLKRDRERLRTVLLYYVVSGREPRS